MLFNLLPTVRTQTGFAFCALLAVLCLVVSKPAYSIKLKLMYLFKMYRVYVMLYMDKERPSPGLWIKT